jgi:hypothetical protein
MLRKLKCCRGTFTAGKDETRLKLSELPEIFSRNVLGKMVGIFKVIAG